MKAEERPIGGSPSALKNMDASKQTTIEAGKALDALAALSVRLSCHYDNVPPHALVLPAAKLREACDTIDEAVGALKKILMSTHDDKQGPAA